MKTFFLTNIPAPYRQETFQIIGNKFGSNFQVLYCAKNEPNRNWNIIPKGYSFTFLNGVTIKIGSTKFIHINLGIIFLLNREKPDIIVISGFSPTMIISLLWAKLYKKKIIYFSDANLHSEINLSIFHRLIRKILIPRFDSLIGVSKKSIPYYEYYGGTIDSIFICPYTISFDQSLTLNNKNKKYDIVYSGQFIERKNPQLFLEVIEQLKKKKTDLRVLLLGNGIYKDRILSKLTELSVNYDYFGNISPDNLMKYYASSKILLFTTKSDAWGVVANEACSVGTPVLISNTAGAADDLIVDGYNGYVLNNLDVSVWVDKIEHLLNDTKLYNYFSSNALIKIKNYSSKLSADQYIACFKNTFKKKIVEKKRKVVVLTNIPSPYRQEVYQKLGNRLENDFFVFYCSRNEANRSWKISPTGYQFKFLKGITFKLGYSKYTHINYNVISKLNEVNPYAIIIGGFSPTMLLSFMWGKILGKKIIYLSAENHFTFQEFNFFQRQIRKFLMDEFDCYIGISHSTIQHYQEKYLISKLKCFVCSNSIESNNYIARKNEVKKYDIVYSGQFILRKKPELFLSIIEGLKKRKPSIKVLLLGDGPYKDTILAQLSRLDVEYEYPGNLEPHLLNRYYMQSKLLLLTTESDAWGITANEACLAGVPVLISENAGAANDLIIDEYNGYVLNNNNVEKWIEQAFNLLVNQDLYDIFSKNAIKKVKTYNSENAAIQYINCLESIGIYE